MRNALTFLDRAQIAVGGKQTLPDREISELIGRDRSAVWLERDGIRWPMASTRQRYGLTHLGSGQRKGEALATHARHEVADGLRAATLPVGAAQRREHERPDPRVSPLMCRAHGPPALSGRDR